MDEAGQGVSEGGQARKCSANARRRLGRCALLIALAWSAAAGAVSAVAPESGGAGPVIATAEETRAIVQAVLEAVDFAGEPAPPTDAQEAPAPASARLLLLVDESLCLGDAPGIRCDDHLVDAPPKALAGFVSRALFDDLARANVARVPLDLSGIPGTAPVRRSDLENLGAWDGWPRFHRDFPDTKGFMKITRPVLSEDRSVALIYVTHYCGPLCAVGMMLRLERSAQGWRVVAEKGVWVS
ncbi:hypothetical protein [Lysobacter sp. FW306-1B-D06B]|uniref:hypothetical protein n=1 Tax=Lysobacter sp. FW306-1B-D06B TaxID=3140250 RepID=UPI00313FE864